MLVLGILAALSQSSGQDVEFIKKEKDILLLKILDNLKTRKTVGVNSKKTLSHCQFESEVSR